MRAVVQRVSEASVTIDGVLKSKIGVGFLVLLGVEGADTEEDAVWLAGKIAKLRVFQDPQDLMNLALSDVGGAVLVVSQFTLHARTKKGNRPSFDRAAAPDLARSLYERFVDLLRTETGREVATGEFGAMMKVALVNDGPVTIVIDSKIRE